LVIGGSGSIGSATVRAMIPFRPRSIHVVDRNENTLAELVRDLRSGPDGLAIGDFRTLPLDFGSPIMRRFLMEQEPYDGVLNFAALKHVRSEKDIYSLLSMLDTNIVKPARLLRWLAELGFRGSYFCVSTDKAANPVNMMGASKRAMEHVAFSGEAAEGFIASVSSARFANVAFSDGSLLQSFCLRLEKRQPLAVPANTRRYFVSLAEAGHICLLAAVCAPNKHLLVPRLSSAYDLRELEPIAVEFLRMHHWEPRIYRNENEARANVEKDMSAGHYPLLITDLDTSGEKAYEEFVGADERALEIGMSRLLAVPYQPRSHGTVAAFLTKIEELLTGVGRRVEKRDIVRRLSMVVPELKHIERGKSLDERM
jgi:FlaA1/EpsC-like NDP-sugar epimerase